MPPIVSLPVVERVSLDNSILGKLGTCPRKTFYNYRLDRAADARSYPIDFGNMYHKFREVLERIYQQVIVVNKKDLSDPEVTDGIFTYAWGVAIKGWVDPPIEHKKSYLDKRRAHATCKQAFDNWLNEKRTGIYTVLSSEAPFQLVLPGWVGCSKFCGWETYGSEAAIADWVTHHPQCPECGAPFRFRYFSGKIDQLLTWNKRLWFRDWKTTSWKEEWSKRFNPDHQFTGYTWAAGVLSGGRRVEGGIIEVVYNIKSKGPEFHPTLVSRTQGDIDHWLVWVHESWAEWEWRCQKEQWTMRTEACGNYGGCFFRPACNSGDWGTIESWLEQNTVESHWDPMNPESEEGLPE